MWPSLCSIFIQRNNSLTENIIEHNCMFYLNAWDAPNGSVVVGLGAGVRFRSILFSVNLFVCCFQVLFWLFWFQIKLCFSLLRLASQFCVYVILNYAYTHREERYKWLQIKGGERIQVNPFPHICSLIFLLETLSTSSLICVLLPI